MFDSLKCDVVYDSITFKVVRRQVYDHSDLIGGYAKDTSATRRQIYAWNDLIG